MKIDISNVITRLIPGLQHLGTELIRDSHWSSRAATIDSNIGECDNALCDKTQRRLPRAQRPQPVSPL